MHPLLYLLPLGLIFDACGYMPPYLNRILTYFLLALPLCLRPSRNAAFGGLVLLAAMLLQAVFSLPPLAEFCLLLLAHQAVWALTAPMPSRLNAGLLFYTMLHVYLFFSPLGLTALEWMAQSGARVSGLLTRSSYNLGFTYQNIAGLLLFLTLSAFNWERSNVSKWRTASFLAVAVFLNALLAALLIQKIDFTADFTWELKYRELLTFGELANLAGGLVLLALPAVGFLAQLAAFLLLHYDMRKTPLPREPVSITKAELKPTARGVLLTVAALLLTIAITPPTAWRKPTPAPITFLHRGVVSFTKPDYTRFGRAAGGMYGLFPEYVKLFGCRSTVVKAIPEVLDPEGVLVVTNLDEPLEPAVHQRIWDFVAGGGGLWVMGEHTFIKNGRNHMNDLLEPCDISLRNDSAQFFPQGWFNCYRFRQGTPFGLLQDAAENRPAMLVGASIVLEPPAQPFVMGRFGYSDHGLDAPSDKGSYIGDFEYQPHERLGDLVLIAGQQFGKGRVLVFGDTTSFFNSNLPRSYELMRASLSWLGESNGWLTLAAKPARLAIAAAIAALLALALLARSRAPLASTLLALGILSAVIHRPSGLIPFDTAHARERMAIIDFSHQPFASKHSSMTSGLFGLSINLMRYSLLPVAMDRWDRELLDAAGLIAVNAPRGPFSARERDALNAFMTRGGYAIVGCGYPHAAGARSLLEPLGLSVRGLPLGRFFDRTAFGRPVSFVSSWPIVTSRADVSALCMYDDWPLIVLAPTGNGGLVLIGDSEFLQNRNVESHESHDPASVEFIRGMLDHTIGKPDS